MTNKEKYVLEHYLITEDGKIFSNKHTKFNKQYCELKYRVDKNGYLDVSLVYDDNGHRQPFRVSRLVALKYIPNPNNYPVVNHKDLNKQNNNVSNLEWCTIAENTQHGFDNGAYKHINPLKITYPNGETCVFPTTSNAAKYFGYKNSTTLEHIAKGRQIPCRGKLKNCKIEYVNRSVTTIEQNLITANEV